ncbi:MAG: protease complex subunit PrcB family protein [Firmicutes bacterium]|nr:protease complex subunit PrcB family protein [Bacillota bacterium]
MARKAAALLVAMLVAAVLLAGCSKNAAGNQGNNSITDNNNITNNNEENNFSGQEPAPPTTEDELVAWTENSKGMFLAQSRELDGKQYFLVTYGAKESNGYEVEITGAEVLEDRVRVQVMFHEPADDMIVQETETYPYVLDSIDATGLPVEFVAEGAETYVPQLLDLDYLRPIAAGSAGIKVFYPAPGDLVERRFSVEGVANVFEGNFLYQLTDSKNRVIVSGYSTAAMGDWKRFLLHCDIDSNLQIERDLQLMLYTESAVDGSVQDKLVIDLTLAGEQSAQAAEKGEER